MSISNSQSVKGLYTSSFLQENSNRTIASQPNSTTESYTVNISETALELSQRAAAGEISTEILYEDLPPEWFSEWIPDEAVLSDQVGLSLSNSGIRQSSNGLVSSDRMVGEYVDTFLQYFQEELKDNGIEGGVDCYTSVLKDEETSEKIHQAMKDRISDDLRARELMQSFGKSL